jgi:hypothetical protein
MERIQGLYDLNVVSKLEEQGNYGERAATARRHGSLVSGFPTLTVMSTRQNRTTIDTKTLETAADIRVFNSRGDQVRFGDIFADQKTIIVFIRALTPKYDYISVSDSFIRLKGISFVG